MKKRKRLCGLLTAICMGIVFITNAGLISEVQAKETNGLTVSNEVVYLMPGQAVTINCSFDNGAMDATRMTYTLSTTEFATVTWAGFSQNIGALQLSYVADGQTVIAVYNQDDMSMIQYIQVVSSTYQTVNKEGLQIKHNGKMTDEKGTSATIQSIEVTKTFEKKYNELKVTCTWDGDNGNLYSMFPFATFYDTNGNILKKQVDVVGGLALGQSFTARWFIPEHAKSVTID